MMDPYVTHSVVSYVLALSTLSPDRWWQPAIEAQAIDRVNRIGQTKPCVPERTRYATFIS